MTPPLGLPPLLHWYHAHKREMPWRGHPDPYAVWVSEIMLQQTQVETVRPYFARFIARFPGIPALAAAPETDLLKAWEGLGYYSRAHNLQKAARILAASWRGALPATVEELRTLPGIGPYTAAAIASICFNLPAPVVDGNVIRVLARLLALPGNLRTPSAHEKLRRWLLPHIEAAPSPGDFNQAVMELGALTCTPVAPACGSCPLAKFCIANQTGRQAAFPAPPPKKSAPVRHFAALLLRDKKKRLLLIQRPAAGLLPGLWELPTLQTKTPPTLAHAKKFLATLGHAGLPLQRGPLITHTFSHFKQSLRLFIAATPLVAKAPPLPRAAWVANPSTLPLTTAARRLLGRATEKS